jgi:phage N-6-adenine-methyltransferase
MTHERNADASRTDKDEQRTPPSLFKKLDDRFDFTVDIAATADNHMVPIHYSEFLNDKAHLMWTDVAWCNPPYSAGKILPFLKKGYTESLKGAVVVFLLPADISTKWFDYCMLAAEWIRIKGRVQFNHADGAPIKGSPKFGSLVVIFDEKRRKQTGYIVISEMNWK